MPAPVMRRAAAALLAVCALAALALYYTAAPDSGLYPPCMMHTLTGWQCPGCGSQRALHALLHGRVAEAWACNRALPLIAAAALTAAVSPALQPLHRRVTSRPCLMALAAALVAWTVVRNIIPGL